MEPSCYKKLKKARRSFCVLKSKVPFNKPSIIKLQLHHSMVLSILLNDFPGWHPNITSLKRLESFQRSCSSLVFGTRAILPRAPQKITVSACWLLLEYITSFLCQLLQDKYIFTFIPFFSISCTQTTAPTFNDQFTPLFEPHVLGKRSFFRSCSHHGKLFGQK